MLSASLSSRSGGSGSDGAPGRCVRTGFIVSFDSALRASHTGLTLNRLQAAATSQAVVVVASPANSRATGRPDCCSRITDPESPGLLNGVPPAPVMVIALSQVAMIVLMAGIFWLGIYPKPILEALRVPPQTLAAKTP